MTAQTPHRLVNRHPGVNLDGLNLYAVIRGPVEENHGWGRDQYQFSTQPRENPVRVSSNWAGFICEFLLDADGRLTLLNYHYPHSTLSPTPVQELLTGDFFLLLKPEFFAPRVYLPFLAGKIQTDPATWLREEHLQVQRFHTEAYKENEGRLKEFVRKKQKVEFAREFEQAERTTEKLTVLLRYRSFWNDDIRAQFNGYVDFLSPADNLSLTECRTLTHLLSGEGVEESLKNKLLEKLGGLLMHEADQMAIAHKRSRFLSRPGWFTKGPPVIDETQVETLRRERMQFLRELHHELPQTGAGKESRRIENLVMTAKCLEVEVHWQGAPLLPVEAWQRAIGEAEPPSRFDLPGTPDQVRRLVTLNGKGEPGNFELLLEPWSPDWPISATLRDALPEGSSGACFRWGVHPGDCRAGLLGAATLAMATGGLLFDVDEDRCMQGSQALPWVREILAGS